MQRFVHSLTCLALLLIMSSSLYGQSLIQGQLTNKAHQPLPQASVVLFQVQDSSFVSFAITKQDGSFRIPKVKPGLYYLQYTASGYTSSLSDPIRINPERSIVPIGVKILRRKQAKPIVIKPARA
ncbi:MAG: carboxypeptidase-like regulatory domain-containing protein [Saprospiraceae bacterium]|nr:carboxypeptidase-like regulatory domain-containing protein [Saprospiraceae bacterium]